MNKLLNTAILGLSACSLLLAEAATAEDRLKAISTRAKVLTGNDVMIAGFIIEGTNTQCVVVRARGPSVGVPEGTERLSDPRLRVVRQSDKVLMGENDDWETQDEPGDLVLLTDSGLAPTEAAEAAVYKCLEPGAYTAVVSGASNGTGAGIVEVIDVSPLAAVAESPSNCEWVYSFGVEAENIVNCPESKYAITGGCSIISSNDVFLERSFPTGLSGGKGDWKDATGWSCRASSDALSALDANALCCDAGSE